MPQYRALKMAFHDGHRVRVGQVISADFPRGKVPAHFELVPEPVEPKEPEQAPEPFKAEHKGNGKWAVIGPDGEVESGLEKQIAMAQAAERNQAAAKGQE